VADRFEPKMPPPPRGWYGPLDLERWTRVNSSRMGMEDVDDRWLRVSVAPSELGEFLRSLYGPEHSYPAEVVRRVVKNDWRNIYVINAEEF
jgi:hypothetical protein